MIDWVLSNAADLGERGFVPQVADFATRRDPPKELAERLRSACDLFPCDLLFVHRDAERKPLASRVEEIERAAAKIAVTHFVPVVPVRMTEAWLLIDAGAIRHAAGNPSGEAEIGLPPVERLEQEPNPKALLRNALIAAAGNRGRRLHQFQRDLGRRVLRVGETIEDFTPLRQLAAFRHFEAATLDALRVIGAVS